MLCHLRVTDGIVHESEGNKSLINKAAHILLLACLLISANCCPSHDERGATESTQGISSREASSREASSPPGSSANNLDFALTNFTGAMIFAVYLSPSDSHGWEENILGEDKLEDGDTANIRFNPQERASFWDLRVEGPSGYSAEWKRINLREVTRITLRINLDNAAVIVAEIE